MAKLNDTTIYGNLDITGTFTPGSSIGISIGGTGLSGTTSGSYIRSDGTDTFIERTPTEVKTDLSLDNVTNHVQVNLEDNQTISGIKTFTSFPVTPSSAPTTDYQIANKKYIDDKVIEGTSGAIVGDNIRKITVGSGTPTSPDTGDFWLDTN